MGRIPRLPRIVLSVLCLALAAACGAGAGASASRSATPGVPSPSSISGDLAPVTVQVGGLPKPNLTGPFDLDQFVQTRSDSPQQDVQILQSAGFRDGFSRVSAQPDGSTEAIYVYRFGDDIGPGRVLTGYLGMERSRPNYTEFPVSGVKGATGNASGQPDDPRTTAWRVYFIRHNVLVEIITFSTAAGFGSARVTELARQEAALLPAG